MYIKNKQSMMSGKVLTQYRTKHTATGCIRHPDPVIYTHRDMLKYEVLNCRLQEILPWISMDFSRSLKHRQQCVFIVLYSCLYVQESTVT